MSLTLLLSSRFGYVMDFIVVACYLKIETLQVAFHQALCIHTKVLSSDCIDDQAEI